MNETEIKKSQQAAWLTVGERFKLKIAQILIRTSPLWAQVKGFANYFENNIQTDAKKRGVSKAVIETGLSSGSVNLWLGFRRVHQDLDDYKKLWDFISWLGIQELEMDVRLESNQITDIITLLYTKRRHIRNALHNDKINHSIKKLISSKGIHIACTRTRINEKCLRIEYTYCILCFSRIVRWFEHVNSEFRDHRALFTAAPRYAFSVAALATIVPIILAVANSNWMLLTISILEAVVLFIIIYLFFSVVGSIEYDNEETNFNLTIALRQLEEYTNRFQTDIKRAQAIQMKFLPSSKPEPFKDKLNWAWFFRPQEQVGGDYFDLEKLDDNKVAMIFCDVSGHGMSAAFITAIVKTTFQIWTDNKQSLTILAQDLNSNLYRITPDDSFAAAVIAVFHLDTGVLEYANLGHNPEPLISTPDKNIVTLSDANNLLLGVNENIDLQIKQKKLLPGQTLIFVSDGITEAVDADENEYGIERFCDFIRHSAEDNEKMVNNLYSEIISYTNGADQLDDQTILTMKITGK